MLEITFKNVGQGDSIIVEWEVDGKKFIGIIDSNIYNGTNPVLDYIANNSIKEIEFIILTHFHYDHFSGFPELFKHVRDNGLKINLLFHSISEQVLQIYNKISTSKRVENAVKDFFNNLEDIGPNITDSVSVNHHLRDFNWSEMLYLSFLAPNHSAIENIAVQINRKINTKEFKVDDLNKFSIISYFRFRDKGIILTADSVKGSYRHLIKFIDKEIALVQAPHHGSWSNVYEKFWDNLKIDVNCPVVFSVGNEPKDKLPNKETVEYFDLKGFDVFSTNYVYGICDHFEHRIAAIDYLEKKSNYLDHFSTKIRTINRKPSSSSKYEGDQKFRFSLYS